MVWRKGSLPIGLRGLGGAYFSYLRSKASNLSFCLSLAVYDSNWFGLGEIPLKLGSAGAAGQTLTGVIERISHFQAGLR